jgi:hypothetical protein
MADAVAVLDPGWRAENDNGEIIAGGILKFFDAGTTAEKTVYADEDLTVSLGTEVQLNSGGYPITSGNVKTLIYVGSSPYKIRLVDDEDVTVWEHDDVRGALDTAPFDATFAKPEFGMNATGADFVILASEVGELFDADCSGGDLSVTLPNATQARPGVPVGVRHAGSQNNVTTATVVGQTIAIPGSTPQSITLTANGETIWLVSNGVGWELIGKVDPSAGDEIIQDTTVSVAVSSIAITIPTGVRNFRISGTGFSCSTTGNLNFRLSDTAGADFETITGRQMRDNANTVAGSDIDSSTASTILSTTAAVTNGNFVIEVFNVDKLAAKKNVRAFGASAGDNQANTIVAETASCDRIDQFVVLFSAGDIDAGRVICERF